MQNNLTTAPIGLIEVKGLVLRNHGLLRRLVENIFLHSSHGGRLPPNIDCVEIDGLPC